MFKLTFMIFIAACFLGDINAKADTLQMGYFELKPHAYVVKGAPKGSAISYFEKAAKKMGHKIKWHYLPFVRLDKYLRSGKLDGAVMITKNDKRTKYLYYPKESFFPTYQIIAVRKDSKLKKVDSIKDIENFRIGFLKSANLSGILKDNLDKIQMRYVPSSDWIEKILTRVVLRGLDAAYDLNHVSLRYEAKKLGIYEKLRFLKLPEKPMYVYVVFSISSPKGQKLVEQYNKVFDDDYVLYDTLLEVEYNKAAQKK